MIKIVKDDKYILLLGTISAKSLYLHRAYPKVSPADLGVEPWIQ